MSNNTQNLNQRTTLQLIKSTTHTFTTNITTFLLLSFLLFFFRITVQSSTLTLKHFVDTNVHLKTLLSRFDLATKTIKNNTPPPGGSRNGLKHQKKRPFLHLSRHGTLDDDFLGGDDVWDAMGLQRYSSRIGNVTSISVGRIGNGNELGSVEIGVTEIFGVGFRFKTKGWEEIGNGNGGDMEKSIGFGGEEDEEMSELRMLFKGFDLGWKDAAGLFLLVSVFAAMYCWIITAYLVIHSWISGVVFVTVVNEYLERYMSGLSTVWSGSKFGFKRLTGFLLMKWAIRDALTQILGLWFLGEIEDQHSFFGVFVKLKLLPFSVMSPWIKGYDTEVAYFLFTWTLLDTLVGLVFAVDCWVAIIDTRRSGKEVLFEGCYLLYTMMNQAVQLKCFESIMCGDFVRWILVMVIGNVLTSMIQAVVEVYFMVVWLRFYFAARCKDAASAGRSFGKRDLEAILNDVR